MRAATNAVMALGTVCTSCGFVQNATHDGYGASRDDLTVLIADVEARRAANAPFAQWVDTQSTLRNRCTSWDEALGVLYARRSSATVRDQTYVSVAGTLFGMGVSSKNGPVDGPGDVAGVAAWTLICVCMVPIDVVVAPFWFVSGAIGDVGVTDDDLVRAVSDLQRARACGYTDLHVDGTVPIGWPYPYHTHLDALGYDADWLRRHAVR